MLITNSHDGSRSRYKPDTFRVHVSLKFTSVLNCFYGKVKINLSRCLIKHHAMKLYGGMEV